MKCEIKIGKETGAGTSKLAKKVQESYRLKLEMLRYKAKMDALNEEITAEIMPGIDDAGVKTGHIDAGSVQLTVLKKVSVSVADVDGLRCVLGERFVDLVRTKTTYEPEKKLREIAEDPTDPLHIDVIDALAVKVGKPSVTYKVLEV